MITVYGNFVRYEIDELDEPLWESANRSAHCVRAVALASPGSPMILPLYSLEKAKLMTYHLAVIGEKPPNFELVCCPPGMSLDTVLGRFGLGISG